MLLPNFVIGGAPKCGTSSIHNWLADHPEANGSVTKEPFYLVDADHPLAEGRKTFHDNGLEGYAACFPPPARGTRVIFESSTHYLYQETARNVLAALPTRPTVLFILRKPSARVYSSFTFTKQNRARLNLDISFAEYVKLVQREGEAGIQRICSHPISAYVLARELGYSTYVTYLKHWCEVLGPDAVRVALFEDVISSPGTFMQSLSTVLGIDPSFYDTYSFPRENETYAYKSQFLHRGLTKASALIGGNAAMRRGAKHFYNYLFADKERAKKSSDTEAALHSLDEYYRPYNRALSDLLGLDLSIWEMP